MLGQEGFEVRDERSFRGEGLTGDDEGFGRRGWKTVEEFLRDDVFAVVEAFEGVGFVEA